MPLPPSALALTPVAALLITPRAGILHNPATGLAPETALARVTLAGLLENFQTNAAGHILALKHLAPLLAAAARANGATA